MARIERSTEDLHPNEQPAREIAARVPSFAGYAMDRTSGNAVAFVVDERDAQAAAAAVEQLTGEQRKSARDHGLSGGVTTQSARFTFMQLSNWRDSLLLWEDLAEVGARSLDLVEKRNVVEIYVRPERVADATPRIRARFAKAGGDNAALHIISDGSITTPASKLLLGSAVSSALLPRRTDYLTGYVRPMVGGITVSGSVAGCTLGFILKFDNVYYTTTAAHCSKPTQVVTPIVMQQGGHFVAEEAYDPPKYLIGVDSARWNEQVLYRIYTDSTDATYSFGKVAHPTDSLGSLAINGSSPTLTLTAVETGGIADDWFVYHIGVASGWRYGYVVQSCVDDVDVVGDIGYRLHCVFRADFYTNSGDSGGPVIAPYQGGWMAVGMIYGKKSNHNWPYNYDNQGMFAGFRGLDYDLTRSFNSGRLFVK